jgi:hypothetical protein
MAFLKTTKENFNDEFMGSESDHAEDDQSSNLIPKTVNLLQSKVDTS